MALLEAAYVVTALHLSKQPGLVAEIRANIEMRERRGSHTQEQRGQREHLQQQPPPQQGAETHSNDERICTRSRPHEPSHAEAEMQRAGRSRQHGRSGRQPGRCTAEARERDAPKSPSRRATADPRMRAIPRSPKPREASRHSTGSTSRGAPGRVLGNAGRD